MGKKEKGVEEGKCKLYIYLISVCRVGLLEFLKMTPFTFSFPRTIWDVHCNIPDLTVSRPFSFTNRHYQLAR